MFKSEAFTSYDDAMQYMIELCVDLPLWELIQNKITEKEYTSRFHMLVEMPVTLYALCSFKNAYGCTILDRLLYPGCNPFAFNRVLKALSQGSTQGWILPHEHADCLVSASRQGYSLLHRLLYRVDAHGCVDTIHAEVDAHNLKDCLAALDSLRAKTILTHDAYMALFTQENTAGFSVMHQGVNTPHIEVARVFMRWFDENPYFSNVDRNMLLHYRSCNQYAQTGAKRAPRRASKDDMSEVNSWVQARKRACYAVPGVRDRGKLGFHAIEVDVSADITGDFKTRQSPEHELERALCLSPSYTSNMGVY